MTSALQTATASLRLDTPPRADASVPAETSVRGGTSVRVDTEALESAAASLLAPSAECVRLAEDLLRHAPDPGPQPVVDLLGELLEGAVDALTALAGSLTRSSHDLSAAADAYLEQERAALRATQSAAAVLDGA